MSDRGWKIDWVVVISTAIVVGIGLYYLKSADEEYYYKQLNWLLVSILALATGFVIDFRLLIRHSLAIYIGVFLFLVGVLFTSPINGARSWIRLPGFNMQPSELMKIALILLLAKILSSHEKQATVRGLIMPFIVTIIPLGLILKQPDLGTGMLFPPLLVVMVFSSGARILHLVVVGFAGLCGAAPMWLFIMKEYQKNRIRAFLNPELYSAREAWQLIQSLIAIGSGGISGMGWGQGSQTSLDLLSEKHTDFIFGVIAEEGGFYVATGLLIAYLVLVLGGLHIARHASDPSGKLLAVGISTIIGVQVLENVGVVTASLPTTGITLPLISYGGSSMIVTFFMIGLLLGVGRSRAFIMGPEKFTGVVPK